MAFPEASCRATSAGILGVYSARLLLPNGLFNKARHSNVLLLGDSVPKPLGFIAFRQNGAQGEAACAARIPDLKRRSGRVPALPYPPSRLAQYHLNGHALQEMFAENGNSGL